jgi:hypothetical protein
MTIGKVEFPRAGTKGGHHGGIEEERKLSGLVEGFEAFGWFIVKGCFQVEDHCKGLRLGLITPALSPGPSVIGSGIAHADHVGGNVQVSDPDPGELSSVFVSTIEGLEPDRGFVDEPVEVVPGSNSESEFVATAGSAGFGGVDSGEPIVGLTNTDRIAVHHANIDFGSIHG